eukprot:4112044-Pleurochrysis_carterae.AAC.1
MKLLARVELMLRLDPTGKAHVLLSPFHPRRPDQRNHAASTFLQAKGHRECRCVRNLNAKSRNDQPLCP